MIFLVWNAHCSIPLILSPFDNVDVKAQQHVNDIVVYANYHYSVLRFDVYLTYAWLFKKLYNINNIRCELFSKTLL